MNPFAAILAAFALALPVAPAQFAQAVWEVQPASPKPGLNSRRFEPEGFRVFREGYRTEVQNQVRIEQRMVIRITPGPPAVQREFYPPPPRSGGPPRYREKSYHDCVAIEDIVGIKPMTPNRLVLFMRNHHMLSAALERACDADAFYLGAYVQRSGDGKLCAGRDMLRARSGATCQVSRLARLVAIKD